MTSGKVYLVGGGPGDPGLLTLRAAECLRRADVVLYDYLVNPQILSHAPAGAELICLGRHGGDRIVPQDEIDRMLVDFARQGRTVVRLKGGDPVVFAHAGDEIEALVTAGVRFEIVPGITAALAAGSYAGIPLTQAGAASAVALITGQEREGKQSPPLDFVPLVHFPGTLVFYMGVTTAGHWSTALILDGKPADTPAAIVHRCSWPDQQVIRCTLATVADEIERRQLRPPAVVIVGKVVSLATAVNWFTSRPLSGQTVLVTRPEEQAEDLGIPLTELGARVLYQAVIRIEPPGDWTDLDRAIARLDQYDWLVFSSANGVRYFTDRLLEIGLDLRALGKVRIAAIGPATAQALGALRLRADFVPDEFRAEALAEGLAREAAGKRFLLVRASRGREVLAEQLLAAGGQVDQAIAYTSSDVEQIEPGIAEALDDGRIDWVTVTSSAIARSLVSLLGDRLRKSKLISISPITSATLRELGFEPAAEAAEYTMAGLVDALLHGARRIDANGVTHDSPGQRPGSTPPRHEAL